MADSARNNVRQPFDTIQNRENPMIFKVQQRAGILPILNLLVIGSSMGLFLYVNSYFLVNITAVIDKSVFSSTTQTFSCDNYFCDETAYNFMNYYSYYTLCNTNNCQNIICDNYDCDSTGNYGINQYYACQPKCNTLSSFQTPGSMYTAYIMAIISMAFFGTAILLPLIFGFIFAFCGEGLLPEQKASLCVTFIWPKFKYFLLRRRQDWEGFYLNLKALIIIDTIINVCYGVTLSLYIYMQVAQFWQSSVEIANFFMLIWAYLARISMVSQNCGPFWGLSDKLQELNENEDDTYG